MGARVRAAALRKIPYVAVIGAREAADGRVALRLRDGRQLDPIPVADALGLIAGVVASRSGELIPG
jgi:threonyl-tRNA synthetase